MRRPDNNAIIAQYPGPEQLLAVPASEVERILLRHIIEYCRDGMHPMITRNSISTGLFDANGYPYSAQARAGVQRIVEEPDPDNGKKKLDIGYSNEQRRNLKEQRIFIREQGYGQQLV